ncbi:hypothetical protein [Amycolatopsis kentuckyensis]|uniref:hypothetical protein n=1 Tax=Amycolatopsis kentuckyensis TaxID=218823 RepID=UPI003569D569
MNRRAAALLLVPVLLFGSAACDDNKYTEPFHDAPRSKAVNDAPARIVTMPDGFTNWAVKCDDGFRLYSGYHGDEAYSSGFAVPDPACASQR